MPVLEDLPVLGTLIMCSRSSMEFCMDVVSVELHVVWGAFASNHV
jgi:hypothetical protein